MCHALAPATAMSAMYGQLYSLCCRHTAWSLVRHAAGGFQQPSWAAADAWHQYTLHWDSDYIRIWVDANLALYVRSSEWYTATQSKAGNYDAPFDQPFHFIFNLAVGGSWPGNEGADTLPNGTVMRMLVDYIRVYQV